MFQIECHETEISCAIHDQGIGIPEADQEWLFNAFHRGHNVTDRPGTGLGLVIVKRCVDLHGGNIKVESKLDEGTTVTVRLPILSSRPPPAADKEHKPSAILSFHNAASISGGRKRSRNTSASVKEL